MATARSFSNACWVYSLSGAAEGSVKCSVGIELVFGPGLAPPDQIDGGVERNAMNPGIEGGVAAKVVATVPGLQQGFLYRIRRQVLVARDAQAGVVPTTAAFIEQGLEGVRLSP